MVITLPFRGSSEGTLLNRAAPQTFWTCITGQLPSFLWLSSAFPPLSRQSSLAFYSIYRLSFRRPFPSSTRPLPEAEGWPTVFPSSANNECILFFIHSWGKSTDTAELQMVERSKTEDTDAFYSINRWADCSQWLCWWTAVVGGGEWQTQPSKASPTANGQQIKHCSLNNHQCLLLHHSSK